MSLKPTPEAVNAGGENAQAYGPQTEPLLISSKDGSSEVYGQMPETVHDSPELRRLRHIGGGAFAGFMSDYVLDALNAQYPAPKLPHNGPQAIEPLGRMSRDPVGRALGDFGKS